MPIPLETRKFYTSAAPSSAQVSEYMSSVLCSPLSSFGDIMHEAEEHLELGFDVNEVESFLIFALEQNGPLVFPAPDIRTSEGFVDDWWLALDFLRFRLEKICRVRDAKGNCSGVTLTVSESIKIVQPSIFRSPCKNIVHRKIDFGTHFCLSGQKPEKVMRGYSELPSTSVIWWLACNPMVCLELYQGSLPGIIVPGVSLNDSNNTVPLITCKGKEVIIEPMRIDRKSNETLPVYAPLG